jgi:hypothetical protein
MTTNLTRRSFLRAAGSFTAVGGMTYFFPGMISAQAEKNTPPSEQIRIACIGVGNQGKGNLGAHLKNCVAVCEVDKKRLADAASRVEKANGKVVAESDYRKLLDARTSMPWSSPRRTTGTR